MKRIKISNENETGYCVCGARLDLDDYAILARGEIYCSHMCARPRPAPVPKMHRLALYSEAA